jgi:hypothetical protein
VGDVILLFVAFVVVLVGAVPVMLTVRAARRKRALEPRIREKRIRAENEYLDRYLARLDQAEDGTEIDCLEEEKDDRKWLSLSSPSFSGSRRLSRCSMVFSSRKATGA